MHIRTLIYSRFAGFMIHVSWPFFQTLRASTNFELTLFPPCLKKSKSNRNPHRKIPEGSKLQVGNFVHGLNLIKPLMEDDLWWKTTYDGRQASMQNHHTQILRSCMVQYNSDKWKVTGGEWQIKSDKLRVTSWEWQVEIDKSYMLGVTILA